MNDNSEHLGESTDQPADAPVASRPRLGRTAFAGMIVGAGALAGVVGLAGSMASASPELVDDAADQTAETADYDEAEMESEKSDAEWEAIDAALAEFDVCIDKVMVGGFGEPVVEELSLKAENDELTEDEWEKLDAELEALEPQFEACEDALPEGLMDLDFDEEWGEDWGEGAVFVESVDGGTFIEFGEGDGSVTITKSEDGLVVDAEGDVYTETFDFEEDGEYEDDADYDESEADEDGE